MGRQSRKGPEAPSRGTQRPIRAIFAAGTVATVGGWLALAGGLAPAGAQALFPNSAGAQFCMLRSVGVSYNDALRVSIRDNMNPTAPRSQVRIGNGTLVDVTTLQMVDYIIQACPQYLDRRKGGTDV